MQADAIILVLAILQAVTFAWGCWMLAALRRAVAGWNVTRAERDALRATLTDLLALCDHASADAFKNGVTAGAYGGMDEGDCRALGIMDKARAALAALDADARGGE